MHRGHIAVLTTLANGHVYPTLSLCAALVQRGYRVTFATNSQYENHSRNVGSEPILYQSIGPGREFVDWANSRWGLPFDHPRWWSPPAEWISQLRENTS